MSCSRILGIFVSSCSIALVLVSLVTDYWMINYEALGHWGLWHECIPGECSGLMSVTKNIDATRAFMILTASAGFISIFSACASFASHALAKRFGSIGAVISSISAVVFLIIAMAVYTGTPVRLVKHDHSTIVYGWSFYMGWTALPFLCITALCHFLAFRKLPAAGYQDL